jgi:phosphatidylethanolamine-binding protein (PEBP) family uncharacterized protein
MKLSEIKDTEFTETDIPIVYNLLQNLLKKHVPVRYLRFKSQPNNWVESVKIEYDDIKETHSLCVTMNDKDAKSHAWETLAWEIPKMTDRLVLEKRDEGMVFYDPNWMDENDDDEESLRSSRAALRR